MRTFGANKIAARIRVDWCLARVESGFDTGEFPVQPSERAPRVAQDPVPNLLASD